METARKAATSRDSLREGPSFFQQNTIMTTFQRLQTIIAEQLTLNESDVKTESTLLELGADSLDEVEIVLAIEEEFSVEIDDEESANAKTVSDLLALIVGAQN